MKYSFGIVALLAATAIAAPSYRDDNDKDHTPKGGWNSVEYPKTAGANHDASEYNKGNNGYANGKQCRNGPFKFTSTYSVVATPDQVINGTTPTGGLSGAMGYYDFGINSETNTICYNIRLVNFRGNYQSMALTATHVHEEARGATGPPRLAFPNPKPVDYSNDMISIGCLTGPFKTGLPDAAKGLTDSGDGFKVSQIEANPAMFAADVHSSLAVPGAVRGQLA